MIYTYCSSGKIVLQDGEYVCRGCGTVVGYEVAPPRVTPPRCCPLKRRGQTDEVDSGVVKFYSNRSFPEKRSAADYILLWKQGI